MKKVCNHCEGKSEDAVMNQDVPYIFHESAMARSERHIKRLWIALIVSIVMLFASSAIFTYAWLQYDYASYEAITDDGGDANIIGNDGDIYNGYGEIEEAD